MSVFYPKTQKSNSTVELNKKQGDNMELVNVNIVIEDGNPQFVIGSDKIIGYEEVEVCGNCGKVITNKNHKYCSECGVIIREEVSSSQTTFKSDNMTNEIPLENILEENIVKKYLYNKNVEIDIMKPCSIFTFKIDENTTIKELKEFENKILKELSFYYYVEIRYHFSNNTISFDCDKRNFKTHTIYCVEDEIIFHTKEDYDYFLHQTDV